MVEVLRSILPDDLVDRIADLIPREPDWDTRQNIISLMAAAPEVDFFFLQGASGGLVSMGAQLGRGARLRQDRSRAGGMEVD